MPRNFIPDDYIAVKERIKQFWADHDKGSIRTTVTNDGVIVVHAAVSTDGKYAEGSALVADLQGEKPLEKAETAAIGRALVHFGYPDTGGQKKTAKDFERAFDAKPEAAPQESDGAVPGDVLNALREKGKRPTQIRAFVNGFLKDHGVDKVAAGTTLHDEMLAGVAKL